MVAWSYHREFSHSKSNCRMAGQLAAIRISYENDLQRIKNSLNCLPVRMTWTLQLVLVERLQLLVLHPQNRKENTSCAGDTANCWTGQRNHYTTTWVHYDSSLFLSNEKATEEMNSHVLFLFGLFLGVHFYGLSVVLSVSLKSVLYPDITRIATEPTWLLQWF